jgi:two-component system, sporulation sensor kinase E
MFFRTLYSKLLFTILFITICSLGILGFISYDEQKEILSKQIESSLHFASNSVSGEINEFIYERLSDIDFLRKNPILTNPKSDPEDIKNEFFQFIDSHDKYFYGSILLDKEGIVIADMGDGMLGANLSTRTWVSQANSKGIYFSDIYLSPVINRPLVVLAARVEDREGGHLGTVSTSIDLDAFWDLIDRFSKQSNQANSHELAFIINDKGEIIAHPERSYIFNVNFYENNGVEKEKLLKALQSHDILMNEDKSYSYSFSKINHVNGFNNNWYVVISSPTSKMYEPLEQLLVKYLVIFIIVLCASIILSIWLTKYLTKPIYELVERVSSFGKGETPKTNIKNTYEEVVQLSSSFNLMMEQIIDREHEHRKASTILETTNYGVFSISSTYKKITTFNSYCEELFKISKDQVLGKSVEEIKSLNIEVYRFIKVIDFESFNSTEVKHKKIEFSLDLDSKLYTFSGTISSIPFSKEDCTNNDILVMFTDITEQKILEKEILHSEKLNAIGQMAAGIAHEIRNPLTTIKGFLELENGANSSTSEYKPLLINEIERINAILNSMLTISKPKTSGKIVKTNINKILDETILLFVNVLKNKDITVIKKFAKIPDISVNDDYLRQVFFNMFQNANEAMDDGGSLTIITSYQDNQFCISISDTGIGMEQQVVDQLATPFFTTKEQGNGLGLMISYRIIQDLGGKINVQSEKNKGTTFDIYIPNKADN